MKDVKDTVQFWVCLFFKDCYQIFVFITFTDGFILRYIGCHWDSNVIPERLLSRRWDLPLVFLYFLVNNRKVNSLQQMEIILVDIVTWKCWNSETEVAPNLTPNWKARRYATGSSRRVCVAIIKLNMSKSIETTQGLYKCSVESEWKDGEWNEKTNKQRTVKERKGNKKIVKLGTVKENKGKERKGKEKTVKKRK